MSSSPDCSEYPREPLSGGKEGIAVSMMLSRPLSSCAKNQNTLYNAQQRNIEIDIVQLSKRLIYELEQIKAVVQTLVS